VDAKGLPLITVEYTPSKYANRDQDRRLVTGAEGAPVERRDALYA
jgi:hypothetical protein